MVHSLFTVHFDATHTHQHACTLSKIMIESTNSNKLLLSLSKLASQVSTLTNRQTRNLSKSNGNVTVHNKIMRYRKLATGCCWLTCCWSGQLHCSSCEHLATSPGHTPIWDGILVRLLKFFLCFHCVQESCAANQIAVCSYVTAKTLVMATVNFLGLVFELTGTVWTCVSRKL